MFQKPWIIGAEIVAAALAAFFFVRTAQPISLTHTISNIAQDAHRQIKNIIAPSPSPGAAMRLSPVPRSVKAIYLTSWSGASEKKINQAIALAETSEVNGVVIDVKDDTGKIAFRSPSALLENIGSQTDRISNLPELISTLHAHNIYVIVRIAAFQDSYLATHRPELGIKNAQTGAV